MGKITFDDLERAKKIATMLENGEKPQKEELLELAFYMWLHSEFSEQELEAMKKYAPDTIKLFESGKYFPTDTKNFVQKELFPYSKIPVKNAYFCNSKVATDLINIYNDSKIDNVKTKMSVGSPKKQANVIAYFPDDKLTLSGKPLTAFDKSVYTAVGNLWEAGIQDGKKTIVFTLQQVYRSLNGQDKSVDLKESQLEPIRSSIESCRKKILYIDATEQYTKLYPNKKIKDYILNENLLSLKGVEIKASNGEKMEGYAFLNEPILYAYSKSINQVINVPLELLNVYEISNTQETIIFRDRLIQRLALIKNKKNGIKNNHIKYSDLYEYAGIDTSKQDKTQMKRKRESIKKIMDHFVKEKFISSYVEYKNGRVIEGLEVTI